MMELSVMFFSGAAATGDDAAAYELVLDVARHADRAGFASVWLPERHFATLGSPYPNPALLHAAVAAVTERIGLRAGSVVLPLHDPLRVAEDWAVLDVLSGGRVGVSLASGWHARDFAFFPDRYDRRDDVLDAGIPLLQRLWRGEEVEVTGGGGDPVGVRTYPRPVQPELPLWVTAARRAETFTKAGRLGLNLLTHLLDQDLDRLRGNVELYRAARAAAGFDPAGGTVTVMVHTYVGPDAAAVRAEAREPYCASLRANAGLLESLARSRGRTVDVSALGDRELDDFVGFLYDRFVAERALIGSPGTCVEVAHRLAAAGVDEVACLLDFGPPADAVRRSLPHLERLRELVAGAPGPVGAGEAWTAMTGAELYERLEREGASYGPALRCVESVRVAGDRVEGVLDLPARAAERFDDYELHPAVLDNAFLLLGVLAPGALPVGLRRLGVHARLERRVHVSVRRRRDLEAPGEVAGDVTVRSVEGRVLAEAEGVRLRRVAAGEPEVAAAPAPGVCYRLDWVEAAGPPGGGCDRWLVLGGGGGAGPALHEAIEARGVPCSLLDASALDRDEVEEALAKFLAQAGPGESSGLACAWPLDVRVPGSAPGGEVLGAVEGCLGTLLDTVQALVAQAGEGPPAGVRLWVLTRGAQPLPGDRPGGEASGLAQAPVWGLCRVLAHEHPDLWGGIVDVEPSGDDRRAAAAAAGVLTAPREDQVALRGEAVLVPRLVEAPALEQEAGGGPAVEAGATYLLTGGLGDIGLALARALVGWGARHLLLVSRHPLGAGPRAGAERAAVAELERLGARVVAHAADVGDAAQVARLPSAAAAAGLPPVGAVVHLAGVSEGALLATMDRGRLRRVLAPKVAGGWNLHATFGAGNEVPVVLVSALPAIVGPVGVGAANYAAANAFLEALGGWRRARALPGPVLAYGPWARIGMAARHADGLDLLSRYGVSGLDPARALALFGAALRPGAGSVAIADVDWGELAASFPSLGRAGQFSALGAAPAGAAARQAAVTAAGEELLRLPARERAATLHDLIATRVAAVLGMEPGDLPTDRPVTELGLDSLMAIEMRNRLEAHLGVTIPMVELLEGPSVDTLVATASALLEQAAGPLATGTDGSQIEEFVL